MKRKTHTSILVILLIIGCISGSSFAYATEGIDTEEGVLSEKVSREELEALVDAYAEESVGSETAGAVVAIMDGDKIILRKDYGYANVDQSKPITSETVFEWGSTSKLLVYISIMQLVEQGKLDLTADIQTYLPDDFFSKRKDDTPITLLNLMHHNAGWSDNIRNMMYSNEDDILDLEHQLKLYEPEQLYDVGEGVGYSNYGIGVAGYIVERVSGQPYYAYVQEHILDVLDMTQTNVYYETSEYQEIEDRRQDITGYTAGLTEAPRLYVAIYPAGSVIGTLDDMLKLVRGINPQSEVQSPLFEHQDTLNRFLDNSYAIKEGLPGFAHGLFEKDYAIPVVAHAGHTNAFSAEIAISPETGYAFVAMANQGHEVTMTTALEEALFGTEKVVVEEALPSIDMLEGDYLNYRSTMTGFEKLLVSPSHVSVVDNTHILFDGIEAEQVAPYTFVYTDKEGLEKKLYFDVEDEHVNKMAILSSAEYYPVDSGFKSGRSLTIAGILLCGIYFLLRPFVTLILVLFKKKTTLPTKGAAWIDLFGLLSFINSLWLFVMIASFTNDTALMPHFMGNILYMVVAIGWIGYIFFMKVSARIRISKTVYMTSFFAILWSLCILVGSLYR